MLAQHHITTFQEIDKIFINNNRYEEKVSAPLFKPNVIMATKNFLKKIRLEKLRRK